MQYFMLAGTSSNVGKTTVTMGIMAAYKKRGMKVKPFKTGPDYIDPMFHSFVTGEKSINLDTWLLDKKNSRGLFERALKKESLGIIEGVMGLYDGHRLASDLGSSAYLSKLIEAPVILIIDGRGMAKSAAALVKGYLDFDPETKIKGVIINQLSSESHYQLLKKMIEAYNDITCLGYFPKNSEIVMDSRHLGLVPVEELFEFREKVEKAADLAEAHIDLDQLLKIAQNDKKPSPYDDPFSEFYQTFKGLRIGVAKDRAFNFYYEDNFKALKSSGVELLPFSPLKDSSLPKNLDGLYIGGGFPEVFAKELEENKPMIQNVLESLEAGLPCYAECGGLMYLTQSVILLNKEIYQGVGFINAIAKMTKRLQRFGYIDLEAKIQGQLILLKGHEFHHSEIEVLEEIPTAYKISKKEKTWTCGYHKKNVLAGYPHIHFYSNPQFLEALLSVVKNRKSE